MLIYGGTDSHYLIIRQVAEKSKGRDQKRLMPNTQGPMPNFSYNTSEFRKI
jgi:hypothetical protein